MSRTDKFGLFTYELGDAARMTYGFGSIDSAIYATIALRWCNSRLVLTVGRYDYELTPEQLRQFREALQETEVLKK